MSVSKTEVLSSNPSAPASLILDFGLESLDLPILISNPQLQIQNQIGGVAQWN